MCLFQKLPKDNSAEEARKREDERKADIETGKGKIDKEFDVFTPEYYDQFKGDYLDYYNPQVDKKYDDARLALKYNIARAGALNSTGGQKAFGDLVTGYDDQRRAVASDALEATNKIRSQVEDSKSDLYAQNTAAADPSLAAITAAGKAGSLQSPPSFTPVGDIFSSLTNVGAGYYAGRNQALPSSYRGRFTPGSTVAGSKSGAVIT